MHQSDASKILGEERRVVKDDGSVLIVEWDTGATPLGPPPEDRVAETEVVKIAAEHGLKRVKGLSPSPYHYGLVMTPVSSRQPGERE